jgi:hypothetical protein
MRLSIGQRRHDLFGKRAAANRHGQLLEGHPRGTWSEGDAFENAAGIDSAVKVPGYRDFPGGDQIVDGSRRHAPAGHGTDHRSPTRMHVASRKDVGSSRQQGDAVCRQRGRRGGFKTDTCIFAIQKASQIRFPLVGNDDQVGINTGIGPRYGEITNLLFGTIRIRLKTPA